MTLVVVALYCEAKPIINHFSLKKDTASGRFDIYKSPDMHLTISGTGAMRSAVATTRLISAFSGELCAAILNTGICGSSDRSISVGTPILFNKIVDTSSKRAYYPDILFRHNVLEATLHTFSTPVTSTCQVNESFDFADMEAAGFMEAAFSFLPAHSIQCIKIVSDHLDCKKLNPDFVSRLMEQNIPVLENIVDSMRGVYKNVREVLSDSDRRLLEAVAENLKLSATMAHQLRKLAVGWKVSGKDNLDILDSFKCIKADSRFEGKKIFERIKESLTGR